MMTSFINAFAAVLVALLATSFIKWRYGEHEVTSLDTGELNSTYDYIVVGGGSAGAVVASRLSEDPESSVLVLEAGGDYWEPSYSHTPIYWPALHAGKVDWGYFTVAQKHSSFGMNDNKSYLSRGKVLGGTSVLNSMQYTRGSRVDFDQWAENGCTGWSYKDVLPYFLKSEDMTVENLQSSEYHNTGGPLAVSSGKVTSLADLYLTAGQELGYEVVDYNGEWQDGVSPIQLTVRKGTRSSTGMEFLEPNSERFNLHIGLHSYVTKIEVRDKKATGVYMVRNGRKMFISARKEIVVSAGVINTPQLLLLSGIGPKQHLQDLNIPDVADLPVGENLQDHVALSMMTDLKEPISLIDDNRKSLLSCFQYSLLGKGPFSIGGSEATGFFYLNDEDRRKTTPDVQIIFSSNLVNGNRFNFKKEVADEYMEFNPNAHGVTGILGLLHPRSKGTIRLASTDPYDYPLIDPTYLTDEKDVEDLIKAIRIWERFIETPTFKKIGADLSRMNVSFCSMHEFQSEAFWECFVRHVAVTFSHPTSSCKMGADSDPTAVLDPQLRVKGIQGLRVVDASAMPNITSGNTNAPVIMMAEKCADLIRGIDSVKKFRG